MASVTRDKKKYGAPTVYSESRRQKEARELREKELQEQLNKDRDQGRLVVGWRLPILNDD